MTTPDFSKIPMTMTVTELNEYIKMSLEANPVLGDIFIKGEISNFTNHYKTGHLYFTVKDETSNLKAVMFRSSAQKLLFRPENGMKVIVHGRIAAFVRDGQYQLYADSMQPDGVGALYIAYEQLKAKLEAEGLFAPEKKRPLPKIPTRIGIITAPTGAAIRDMINVSGRRFPMAEILLYPALVQGPDAPPQLIAGLNYFSSTRCVDVVIIGRGGGSIEDLWAFNDEGVARAVAASNVPVISAVGHETDFTICDFVADRRAPTPSAAAELALPEANELKRKLNNITTHNVLCLQRGVESRRRALDSLSSRRALRDPNMITDEKRMLTVSLTDKLIAASRQNLDASRMKFLASAVKLDALNPLSILTRGYFAVFDGDGGVLKSVDDVKIGENVVMQASDGKITAKVESVTKNN